MEPRYLLDIFGRGSAQVRPITVPEWDLRRQEEIIDPGPGPVDDIWYKSDVCWGSLVRDGVGSGYLVEIDVS